jgi:hypothetical protein
MDELADEIRAELTAVGLPVLREPDAGASGFSPGTRVRLPGGEVVEVLTVTYGAHTAGPVRGYRVTHPSGDGHLDVEPGDVTPA